MAEGDAPPTSGRPGSAGSALPLAVLALLALQLLAHGLLLLARQERAASLGGLRVLQARGAAEAAASWPVGRPLPDGAAELPLLAETPQGTVPVGPHRGAGHLRRLGREVWLSRGEGRAGGAGWGLGVGRILWAPDPVARAGEDPRAAVVGSAGGPFPSGTVHAPPFRASAQPEWCAPWAAGIDSLLAPAAAPVGSPPAEVSSWPALGPLTLEDLLRHLPPGPAEAVTPLPTSSGGDCVVHALNWGDPLDPGGPCWDRLVALGVPGELTISGGRGQGVLVAAGDVILLGALFHGVVVAGGDVVLEGASRVEGQVRAGGALRLDASARLEASPCRVARAVEAALPLMGGLRTLPGTGPVSLP